MLPLTKHTPVSLLKVGDQSILDYQLKALRQAGIEDTVVITGFCADQVEEFCRGRALCVFNPFYEICHVAMNLWMVREQLREGFLLLYNDIIFQAELVKEVLSREDDTLLVVDQRGVDREAEKVAVREGVVRDIGKDVAQPYGEFIGIAMFSQNAVPALIKELEQVARADLAATFPYLIRKLIGHGHQVKVHPTHHPWIDIDFPGDLEEAHRVWGSG